MLFNSWQYAALLLPTVLVYWLLPWRTARQIALLVASLIFYASWQPIFILLMATVIGSVFVLTLISRREQFGWAAILATVAPLGFLMVFKYTNFAIGVASDLRAAVGLSGWTTQVNLILPLGISFYTFQVISYVVDVRRGVFPAERNPLVFSLFVIFFPHLIAGPICRADQLIPQLTHRPKFAWSDITHGVLLIACGLFLKTALADNLSPYVNSAFDHPADTGGLRAALAILGFGVVILCDFWGYSTMAIGSAYLMGIKLPLNFNLPYAATSLQDFWRRWHITLSNWLRDYLYIPLGGSRRGRLATYRNLVVTFVLGGLWHGAAYTFLVWGLIHGVWLAIERIFLRWTEKLRATQWLRPLITLLGWGITMAVVFTAWVFFRAQTVSGGIMILRQAAHYRTPFTFEQIIPPLFFLSLFAAVLVPFHKFQFDRAWVSVNSTTKVAVSFWLLVATTLLASGQVERFIYFQF